MIRVNLQPKMMAEAKEGFQIPVWVPILAGLFTAVICGGGYWYFNFQVSGLAAQKTGLENKLKDFQTILNQYEVASGDYDYLKDKRDFVQGISSNQHRWIEFLDMLKNKTPKDVWIDKLVVDANGSMKVEGQTYSYDSVANFMYRLTKFPQLNSVALDQAASKTQGGSSQAASAQDSMTKAFKISATAKLNPEAATSTLGLAPGPGATGKAGVGGGGKKTAGAEEE